MKKCRRRRRRRRRRRKRRKEDRSVADLKKTYFLFS